MALFDRGLKDLAVQKEKKAILDSDYSEDLLSYFSQQGFRDEAESDRRCLYGLGSDSRVNDERKDSY